MHFQPQKNHTFFEALLQASAQFGAHTKIVEDMLEGESTYKSLLKKSLALGRLVTKISQPNEAVAVLMPNITNTLALILGMSAFNRIPALLNYTAGSAGMQSACATANIKTIISSKKFIETAKLESIVANLQQFNIIYLEDLRTQFNLLDKAWLMAFALHFPRVAVKTSAPDDIAVILFTSGSEGKPKGVVHTHQSILANIAQVHAILDFKPTDKFMMILPIFHAFGFTGSLLPVFSGIKILIFPSPLQYKIIPEVIYEKGCTVLLATSTFLGHYAKYAHPHDFHQLRIVVAGAEKLHEEVRKTYQEKFGIHILEGYGVTECAPVLSTNTHTANLNGSVGKLVAGLQHTLESVPGIEQGGLLHVKGENVMKGYYLPDAPAKLVPPENGWHNTGDIVHIDQDGFVHIKGRIKRFAKVAGEMVSLEIVETIANTAAPAFQHAATTQTDIQRGETIILFTTDAHLKREDLQMVTKNLHFPEIAIARKIIKVDEIPLLGTGKTDYVTLKNMAEALNLND